MGSGVSAAQIAGALNNCTKDEFETAIRNLPKANEEKLRIAIQTSLSESASGDEQLPLGLRLISSRHCTHSFDPSRAVPRDAICAILDAVRSLPTSGNTQPWTVIVTQGTSRDRLSEKMLAKFDAGDDGKADYLNRPSKMTSRMEQAVNEYGRQFYQEHFGVPREDKAGRRRKYRPNYEFWGAPMHLILCAPRGPCVEEDPPVDGVFLDMGSLLTAICLGAHDYGLGAKPQFSVAKYHDVCRAVLGKDQLPDDLIVVCGVSVGWPIAGRDPREKPDFFPTRLDVDETTRWFCDGTWLADPSRDRLAGNGEHGLIHLIQSRHCSHSLDPTRIVPKNIIFSILAAARNVPSSNNTQPWQITVVQGEARDKLGKRMLDDFDSGNDGKQTYKKYSANPTAQMKKGTDTYGYELYQVRYGLERGDTVGRRLKYRPNYELWGAPVLLLLTVPKNAVAGTFIDVGSFMYAILLGMHACGLGGKPLGSIAKKTDICREVLGVAAMPEDEHLVCGICMGWPADGRDPRETPDWFPSRMTVEETTRWICDEGWLSC